MRVYVLECINVTLSRLVSVYIIIEYVCVHMYVCTTIICDCKLSIDTICFNLMHSTVPELRLLLNPLVIGMRTKRRWVVRAWCSWAEQARLRSCQ